MALVLNENSYTTTASADLYFLRHVLALMLGLCFC